MGKSVNIKAAYVIAAAAVILTAVEFFVGSFPVELFRFPINLLCIALWLVCLSIIYRQRTTSVTARFMLSPSATWLSLALVAGVGITLGLERKPSSDAWIVVAAILFVLSHLTLITIRGWRNAKGIRWRFVLLHLGLIIALGAGFWGAPDREQLRIAVSPTPNDQAYNIDGEPRILGYELRLNSFDIELTANGTPKSCMAEVDVDGHRTAISVNHPYSRTWCEKIYLIRLDGEVCILEVVREPWQWLTTTGIVLLIAGAVMMFLYGPRHSTTENREQ